MKFLFPFICFWLASVVSFTQTLPVGFPVLEESLRRQQLTNPDTSEISYALKPLAYPKSLLTDTSYRLMLRVISSSNDQVHLNLLPMQAIMEYHGRHPHPSYNGAMIPARGFQTIFSPGISGRLGPVAFQFKPEIFHAQNKAFRGWPLEVAEGWPHYRRWPYMYRWWNNIDQPERFGEEPVKQFLPGQSYAGVNFQKVSLNISTQNLWWGPGKYNSLLLTNNAQGFEHLSLHTNAPVSTPVGSFESQLIAGRLEESGYLPPDTSRKSGKNKLYIPKYEDWRYLNGFTLTYHPKWVDGLFVGFGRMVQQYATTTRHYKDYLPVLSDLFRPADHYGDTLVRSHLASVFFRWAGKHSEVYMEYGRNNASWKIRDLITAPQHDGAYIFGATRLVALKKAGHFLEFNLELTRLQQPPDYIVGLAKAQTWYTHEAIRHGHTHRGEVLGSRAGPGGNLQILEVSWVSGLNKVGFQVERLVHNNDFISWAFYGSQGGDFRSYWVDYSFGLNANWAFHKLLASMQLQYSRTLNYQWETIPGLDYFEKGSGVDVNNLLLRTNLAYLF